jgi:hypothetical protein
MSALPASRTLVHTLSPSLSLSLSLACAPLTVLTSRLGSARQNRRAHLRTMQRSGIRIHSAQLSLHVEHSLGHFALKRPRNAKTKTKTKTTAPHVTRVGMCDLALRACTGDALCDSLQ